MTILDDILGTTGRRLTEEIRDRRALAPSVDSDYLDFSDAGALMLSATTQPANTDQVVGLLIEQIQRLRAGDVTDADVQAILASCDRCTALGRRDYAIVILLVRLGLRRGEVAALSLDDLDRQVGELVVRGKGGRADRLPLPDDVGQAIAGWLRRGRPASSHREVAEMIFRTRP